MIGNSLNSKRIISGLVAVILAISTITVIKAEVFQPKQPLTVLIDNKEVAPGEDGAVSVSINTPSTPIATYQIQLEFNKNIIEVTDIMPKHGSVVSKCEDDNNGCFVSNINNNEGWVKTVWVDTSGGTHPIASEKTLFTINFKVKDQAKLEKTFFTINSAQQGNLLLSDDQGKEISPAQVTGGTIVIQGPDGPVVNPTPSKETGYLKILKRINIWNRDQNGKLQFTSILTPGQIYKVYNMDQLYGGQYAVDGGAWITNMTSYVSYRSVSEFGSDAAIFPKGPKNEIGYVTITKPLNLWKRESNGTLTVARVLKTGEIYRVYGTDGLFGGQYNLGKQYWVTQIWDHISFRSY